MRKASMPERLFAGAGAVLGWFALGLQLRLAVGFSLGRGFSFAHGLIVYFGFFTVLTNIFVALVLTIACLRPASRGFFGRQGTRSAVLVYIAMVAIIYSLLLRHLWNPGSEQLIADRLLHDVLPPLYLVYWIAFVPKGELRWINPLYWLIYPVIYFVYILLRGAVIASYPYSFLDAAALGYSRLAVNAFILLATFLAAGCLCVAVDRALGRRSLSAPASPAPRSASG
ncbi:MAG: Pr6Pr family membrane protein [Hyphomicrobiales bacterium]|nr:Pr6Pr family membrane protein [Hyphomicrobiales bacterium]